MDAVIAKKPAPAKEAVYSKETYLKWYETMFRIRSFEERVLENYGDNVRGFCHVYIGQEAIAAGLVSAIRPEDAIGREYCGATASRLLVCR